MPIDGFHIRLCRPGDESAVYDVCLKTGAAGGDATGIHRDPRALGNVYVGPYLRFEPSLAFVLEDRAGVCGYVLGALDSKTFHERVSKEWLPPLRAIFPDPSGDPQGWDPTARIHHLYHHPDTFCPEGAYPSHIHIDLLARARGKGLGSMMVELLRDELRAKGSPGMHLGFDADNHGALLFYRKLGFRELVRRWHAEAGTVFMGMRLHLTSNGSAPASSAAGQGAVAP